MKTTHKTLIALGIAGMLGGTSLGVLADKATSTPEGVVVEDVIVIEQFPSEVQGGSITIKDDNEQAMAAKARLSASEAAQIATKAVPGKVVESQLDEENGFLIWEVSMLSPDGQETQLKLDAGNGKLLAVEAGEDDEHQAGDRKDDDKEDQAENGHSGWKFWEDNDKEERD